jgi:hypothetical protein
MIEILRKVRQMRRQKKHPSTNAQISQKTACQKHADTKPEKNQEKEK